MKGFNINKMEGTDASLGTSLGEYGLGWILSDDKKEYIFYYGIRCDDEGNYIEFDWATLDAGVNVYEEFDWCEFDEVLTTEGKAEWNELELPYKVSDLLRHYGYENMFGTSYDGGQAYNANLNRFEAVKK